MMFKSLDVSDRLKVIVPEPLIVEKGVAVDSVQG